MAPPSPQSDPTTDTVYEMTGQKTTNTLVDEKLTMEDEVDDDPAFEGTKSAPDDKLAMQRMGKKQQLIVRRPPLLSCPNREYVLTCTAETFSLAVNCLICRNGDSGLGDRHLFDQSRSHGWREGWPDLVRGLELYWILSHLYVSQSLVLT